VSETAPILPAAKILEEGFMAAEFPQGVSRAAFRKSMDEALGQQRKPGGGSNIAGRGRSESGCAHGLISNKSVLSPFGVPLYR
jgi:hypothetical protein